MTEISPLAATGRHRKVASVRSIDRVNLALAVVFLMSAGFYLWIASISIPLSLHDGASDRYNLLATAFLHLRLSIGPEPAALLHFVNPYSERATASLPKAINDATSVNDDSLYNGRLYFVWGPAPALVLLVPLRLLGFEPSPSVTDAVYGIAGVGFALATLRVIIRRIGDGLPIWMCVLAGFALSLSSVVPFLMRTPNITMETLAGGYCFVMAGVWLAVSAITSKRASLKRLALMSLCFGLAANSRPTLWLTALFLIPVYLSLRSSRHRRALLASLVLPVGICFVLFLAYNQARFHDPLEIGSRYQLNGLESPPLGRLSYVLPGVEFYALTLPRPEILFPFIHLVPPEASRPPGLVAPEATGGLLPMAPIVVFIAALPWIWRRRPALLGPLAAPLLLLAGVGLAIPIVPSYEFFASTERYEADFATLLVLGGLAGWLSLSRGTPSYRRRLLRVGGGLLAAWGCATGFAISFFGSELSVTHPAVWRTFEDIGSPISTALAVAVGHPVIASVSGGHQTLAPVSYTSLGTGVSEFTVSASERASLIIVSPHAGKATLRASVALLPRTRYGILVDGPGHTSAAYSVPQGGTIVGIPVQLNLGLNRLAVGAIATSKDDPAPTTQVMQVSNLSVTQG